MSNEMHALLRYKQWADAELLRAVMALPDLARAPGGAFVPMIIRHYHTADCVFRAHLLGVPHGYTSANPPDPATLAELEPRVREIDGWYVDYAKGLAARDLDEPLDLTFTDGQRQRLTRAEILLHVSLHGAGHRGQVSVLLKQIGVEPPPDRFTTFLRQQR